MDIPEMYINRPIEDLFKMYYNLPERMIISDAKGKVIFASGTIEKETSENVVGEPLARLIGTEAAISIMNAFVKLIPLTVTGMWIKRRCAFSMTPYDGCMVIFLNPDEPQAISPIIDSASVNFLEREIRSTLSLARAAMDGVKSRIGAGDEKIERGFAVMKQCIMRISNVTSDFLDCAKFDMDKLKIDADIGDLRKCVCEACEKTRGFFDKLDIEFTTDIPDYLVLSAFDKNKISHMIFNILANCCKLGKKTKSVHLSFEMENSSAVISIAADFENGEEGHGVLDRNYEIETAVYADFALPSATAAAVLHGGRLITDSSETGRMLVKVILPVSANEKSLKFNSPFRVKSDEPGALEEFAGVLEWDSFK